MFQKIKAPSLYYKNTGLRTLSFIVLFCFLTTSSFGPMSYAKTSPSQATHHYLAPTRNIALQSLLSEKDQLSTVDLVGLAIQIGPSMLGWDVIEQLTERKNGEPTPSGDPAESTAVSSELYSFAGLFLLADRANWNLNLALMDGVTTIAIVAFLLAIVALLFSFSILNVVKERLTQLLKVIHKNKIIMMYKRGEIENLKQEGTPVIPILVNEFESLLQGIYKKNIEHGLNAIYLEDPDETLEQLTQLMTDPNEFNKPNSKSARVLRLIGSIILTFQRPSS